MRKHLTSFAKSPIGYLANLVATCATYAPTWLERAICGVWFCSICETFCLKDGIQDDPLF